MKSHLGDYWQLSKDQAFGLLLVQAANFALLIAELNYWMLLLIILCFLWRLAVIVKRVAHPSKWLIVLFAIVGCIVLATQGRQLGMLSAMIHLLAFSYALKQLELSKRSDFYQLNLLGLFVIASAMIFYQQLLFAALAIGVLLINVSFWLFNFDRHSNHQQRTWLASKMLLQSLPLAIVLFVVFPRLAPFWQVPLAQSAKTGLTDEVTPGDIANLALSSDLAFRVRFNSEVPAFEQRYWRVLVMEDYDGHTWRRHPDNRQTGRQILLGQETFSPAYQGASLDYQVFAEPSYQHWLFVLDVAEVRDERFVLLPDFSLFSRKIIAQSMSYQVTSYPKLSLDAQISPQIAKRNLEFPAQANPRLVAYAKELRAQYPNDSELIASVLTRIQQQAYRYTLQPPLLLNNSLDQFFFDTQSGFCVHYASAFTYLMRAVGIPARMVTGYMGAEHNPNGDYYNVYQYDAHAWSEVWLLGQGWVRVDPTAAVNPLRVEQGFANSLFDEQSSLAGNLLSLHNYKNIAWLNALRQGLDNIDYQWTRWVVGYNGAKQMQLLANLFGRISLWKMALIIGVSLMSVLLFLWLVNRHQPSASHAPIWLKMYVQVLAVLKRKGVNKTPDMSVSDFSKLVANKFPEIAVEFAELSQLFERLHYQRQSEESTVRLVHDLRHKVTAFLAKAKKLPA